MCSVVRAEAHSYTSKLQKNIREQNKVPKGDSYSSIHSDLSDQLT